MAMNKDEIVEELFEKIKKIEKEVSNKYIGRLSKEDIKLYQKDVVGLIKSELDKLLDVGGIENEN